MRHLVQDHLGPPSSQRVGDLGPEQHLLGERDAADVLHRARVIGTIDLVVLGERVAAAEQAGVVVQALPGDAEDLVGFEVCTSDWRQATRAGWTWPDGVVCESRTTWYSPRDDRGQVGGDPRRRLEMPTAAPCLAAGSRRRLVRQHDPVLGRGDLKGELGLQVGLLEVSEDLAGWRPRTGWTVDPAVGAVLVRISPERPLRSAQSATTRSSLRAASPVSAIRPPARTRAGSRARRSA